MGKNRPNTRMKADRCWRSVVDSARGRAVMGRGWSLSRVAAAAYADRWGATRSCTSSCYASDIMSLTAMLQDITRCSATGILSKRASSGKPSSDADGVRSLRDKGNPHSLEWQ